MILTPYTLTDEEKAIVSSHFADYTDWDKSNFDSLKENLRNHLRNEQHNKCCYCNNELGFDIKNVDIEHIIPKSHMPEFTFSGKNLALSCPACNTIKSHKTVFIKNRTIKKYPINSKNIKIIHPHYDEYEHHIEILDGSIYVALSGKGSETITMCELYRLRIAEEKAKNFRAQKTPIASMVEEFRQGGKAVEDFAEFLRNIFDKPPG
jgi:uncharacterized protein (TIGR02646 family)